SDHDASGLDGRRARPDAEVDGRLGHIELSEEQIRHLLVVMLSGVQQLEAPAGLPAAQRCDDGRRLHEVRAGADDQLNQWAGQSTLCAQCEFVTSVMRSTSVPTIDPSSNGVRAGLFTMRIEAMSASSSICVI